MESKKRSMFLGLFLTILFIYLSYLSLNVLIVWFGSLSESVQAGIVAILPVLLVAIFGFFANKKLEEKRSVEQSMRPKKIELYDSFITFLMRVFVNNPNSDKPKDEEITKFFAEKTPELIIYGSNKVIKKWGKLRISIDENHENAKKLFVFEDFIHETRIDLGHGGASYSKGDILRLFVNDIDNYLAADNKNKN